MNAHYIADTFHPNFINKNSAILSEIQNSKQITWSPIFRQLCRSQKISNFLFEKKEDN